MNFLVKGTQGLFYVYNDGNHGGQWCTHIDMIYLFLAQPKLSCLNLDVKALRIQCFLVIYGKALHALEHENSNINFSEIPKYCIWNSLQTNNSRSSQFFKAFIIRIGIQIARNALTLLLLLFLSSYNVEDLMYKGSTASRA